MQRWLNKRNISLIVIMVALTIGIGVITRAAVHATRARSHSLRVRAQNAGKKILVHKTVELKVLYPDLESLAAPSAAVIVGTPMGSGAHLSKDEHDLSTDYQFRVDEVVKGGLKPGDMITVRLPGGAMSFGGEAVAEVRTEPGEVHKMEIGQKYALFLRSEPKNIYTFTGGPQGAFFLGHQVVRSNDEIRHSDPIVKRYHGMSVPTFLEQFRQSVS